MVSRVRHYKNSDSGVIAVIVALLLPIVLGMAVLAVDASNWNREKRKLQTAADAGALAGAYEIAHGLSHSQAEAAALQEAQKNGFNDIPGNRLEVVFGTDSRNRNTVKVTIYQQQAIWFVGAFLSENPVVMTTATALVGLEGPYCILALDKKAWGAVSASGSVTVNSPTCGIAVNSTSTSALSLTGSATMIVGEVSVAGDIHVGGNSVTFTPSSERTGANPTTDPYEDTTVQPYSPHCSASQQKNGTLKISGSGVQNLTPGVFCGGIDITGTNDVKLAPGVYVMDGGNFSASGNGLLAGTDVTIVLTSSTGAGNIGRIDVTGGKNIALTAPTTGPYAGLVIYQDRNAPSISNPQQGNRLSGNAELTMSGVAYTPSQPFTFGGNSAYAGFTGKPCTKIIAATVTFSGNPSMGNSCEEQGTLPIGVGGVTLIE